MNSLSMPVFNPMTFAKRLKEAGVPECQADAEAEVLHDALLQQAQAVSVVENKIAALDERAKREAEQMATKGDIAAVKEDVAAAKADIVAVKADIAAVKADIALVRKEIIIVRRDTIIWLGGMLIAGFGSVLALLLRLPG